MSADPRGERLQIMLTSEELAALDQWRFSRHMPSRAAAIRELLRRGLAAEGFDVSDGRTKSADFGVIGDMDMVADRKP
jgi:metal-responsive CopG/Arc/MetJ family transcriptional regulator